MQHASMCTLQACNWRPYRVSKIDYVMLQANDTIFSAVFS